MINSDQFFFMQTWRLLQYIDCIYMYCKIRPILFLDRQISNVETKYKQKFLAWVSKQKRIALKALKEESAYLKRIISFD